ESKRALEKWTRSVHGLKFDPDALCDCQVKRIHEYKRQLLNVLHVLALYLRIKDGVATVPRTVLFAGKAAPSYVMAKRIIKLIHEVGSLVNGDPATAGRLHVLFVPNYSVSAAEVIFPACELSEQISTAGTEASGTGVMKGALNGALTIGTLDGANIELRDEVGEENVFVFGRTASEIDELRAASASPSIFIQRNEELARVLEFLAHGPIEQASPGLFAPVVDLLTRSDRYFHAADFSSYVAAQESAARVFAEGDFAGMSIRTVAGSGRFSSDRAVAEYASSIWRAPAVPATRADALRAGGSKDPGSL
ncbi:MAG TPA: glycogen/starch/alpha-glucan phosphorylase, partial [Thermoanaerobaculia bacterium]|nr:glycogen/starch/alpha-glucan phosphorylase [Thermoanaerobaculia bacterium]